jgi:hypothetical protein
MGCMSSKKAEIYVAKPAEARQWIDDADLDRICQAWHDYRGDATVFESAAGSLLLGRFVGLDAIRIIHSATTIRKYEAILGKDFKYREQLQKRTKDTDRLNGIRYARQFDAFWRALAAGVSTHPGARRIEHGLAGA